MTAPRVASLVSPRDWAAVEHEFEKSAPFNYVILDDFLTQDACEALRIGLVGHWAWRFKNPVSRHLHNERVIEVAEVRQLVASLQEHLVSVLHECLFTEAWALMYQGNGRGRVHGDLSVVTLTFWPTPERCNLDPESGGLVLYDVKRSEDVAAHDHLSAEWSEEYVAAHTNGDSVVIPYAGNRAILFDGRTFHRSDEVRFAPGADCYRVNLTIAFESEQNLASRNGPNPHCPWMPSGGDGMDALD